MHDLTGNLNKEFLIMFYTSLFLSAILLCTGAYCADDFNEQDDYTPIPQTQTRFTPTTEINIKANLPRASNLIYYRGVGNFVDIFGRKHALEFNFDKLLPAHLKDKIPHSTCKFYILSPSASTKVLSLAYLLRNPTKTDSQPSLSFCLPKKVESKKKSDELYLEFEQDTGNFIGILDQAGQAVDPTTLSLTDIQFYKSASPKSGKITSDVNNAEITLNLGNINSMDGIAYIGDQFTFKLDHDGQELNPTKIN